MPADSSIIILCPMRLERIAIRAAIPDAYLPHVYVIQTGIGKDAILSAVDTLAGFQRLPDLLILAGAAGGLTETQDCPPIARIVDESGNHWTPFGSSPAEPNAVTLVGVDRIISTPADKKTLATKTGASIVDMESHAFAPHCTRLNINWSVVRAVSDTPRETLPHEVLNWITPEGNERTLRAAWDMLKKPSLIPHIRAVMRRSNRVLPQAGERVVQLIRELETSTNRSPLASTQTR